MKKNIKLSVGIPAFNERANIKKLLKSIIFQIQEGYSLLEIIVISDGSTDGMENEVVALGNSKIKLIKGLKRMGKSERLNQIMRMFKGEILFLLDADIVLSDTKLFKKIIDNNDFNKFGLVGVKAVPSKPENLFQKIIIAGSKASDQISANWNKGQNYLSFKGCFLGMSRTFATKIEINSKIVNNDAYIYFKAKSLGYQPNLYKNAHVNFKSPKNFADYIGQSRRFTFSKNEMENVFNKDLGHEYNVPFLIYIKVMLANIIFNPIYFINYLIVKSATFLKRYIEINSTWRMALSTK